MSAESTATHLVKILVKAWLATFFILLTKILFGSGRIEPSLSTGGNFGNEQMWCLSFFLRVMMTHEIQDECWKWQVNPIDRLLSWPSVKLGKAHNTMKPTSDYSSRLLTSGDMVEILERSSHQLQTPFQTSFCLQIASSYVGPFVSFPLTMTKLHILIVIVDQPQN